MLSIALARRSSGSSAPKVKLSATLRCFNSGAKPSDKIYRKSISVLSVSKLFPAKFRFSSLRKPAIFVKIAFSVS